MHSAFYILATAPSDALLTRAQSQSIPQIPFFWLDSLSWIFGGILDVPDKSLSFFLHSDYASKGSVRCDDIFRKVYRNDWDFLELWVIFGLITECSFPGYFILPGSYESLWELRNVLFRHIQKLGRSAEQINWHLLVDGVSLIVNTWIFISGPSPQWESVAWS